MPTELREAKIRVVLDLEDSTEAAESLEEKVKRTREEQKDAERVDRRPGSGKPGDKISLRRMRFGALQNTVRQVLESIPAVGFVMALGIGTAEMNERFGPGLEAFLKGALPDSVRKVMEELGIDMDASADVAKWWGENKSFMMSLTAAFDRTGSILAAAARTGGVMGPGDAMDEFGEQRRMAETEANIEKTRRRIMQISAGSEIGRKLKLSLDAAGRPGVGR